jgi:hypothetical protein
MAKYLVVAHQTAESPELRESLAGVARDDPEAEFVLLVPATPVSHLLIWEEGETRWVAERTATRAGERLRAAGLRVVAARVGDASPHEAIADAVRADPGYRSLIISTFPPGVSRWLRMDPMSRIERRFPGWPVRHVVAQPNLAPAESG